MNSQQGPSRGPAGAQKRRAVTRIHSAVAEGGRAAVNDPHAFEPAALVVRALRDGRPRSRRRLSRECAVDEAILDEALDRLSWLGIDVSAVADEIALPRPVDLLDADAIRRAVPRLPSEAVHVRFAVESTNTVLAERLRTGIAGPELCTAEVQTAGRGRYGRPWVSGLGQSLVLSVSRRFTAPADSLSGLSLAAGVGLAEALAADGFEPVMLKWPNDLVAQQRKLAGILVEASHSRSAGVACVVGVGFNLDLGPDGLDRIDQPWTDFARAFGRVPVRSRLASSAANALLDACAQYEAHGLGPFAARWRERDALRGRPVRAVSGGTSIEGTARGIDDDGALLVEHAAGIVRCDSGEVTVRAVDG